MPHVERPPAVGIDQGACALVDLVIGHLVRSGGISGQVRDLDHALSQVAAELDVNAAGRHARDHRIELVLKVTLGQHLQHEEAPQLALGIGRVLLLGGAVARDLDEFILVRDEVVIAQLLAELSLGAVVLGPVNAVVRQLDVRRQRAVHSEVGIPADRAREVRIRIARQRKVPHQRGCILRLGQRAQHSHVHSARSGRALGRFEQALQFLSRRMLRHAKARDHRCPLQTLGIARRGLRVHAADQRHIQILEQPRGHLVGLDHEHLDERVREGIVLGHRIDDVALLIEHKFDLGQIERDHPLPLAPGVDRLGKIVHVVQGRDDVIVVLGLGARMLLGFFPVPIDERLGFEVRQALSTLDERLAHALCDAVAVAVVPHVRRLHKPRHALLQGADAVGKHLGQHRNHQPRQVHRVAAGCALDIQGRPGLDEVRHIRDVNAQLPSAVIELPDADRVVEVLRVRRVDRQDQFIGLVRAQVERRGALALPPLDLLIKRAAGLTRLLDAFLRKLPRQAVGCDDRLGLDIGPARFAQHARDHALGKLVVPRILNQFKHDLVARLDVLGIRIAHDDRPAKLRAVRLDKPLAALLEDLARELATPALDDLLDPPAVGRLAILNAALTPAIALKADAHNIARERVSRRIGRDEDVTLAERALGAHKAKAPACALEHADEFTLHHLDRWQHEMAPGRDLDHALGSHGLHLGPKAVGLVDAEFFDHAVDALGLVAIVFEMAYEPRLVLHARLLDVLLRVLSAQPPAGSSPAMPRDARSGVGLKGRGIPGHRLPERSKLDAQMPMRFLARPHRIHLPHHRHARIKGQHIPKPDQLGTLGLEHRHRARHGDHGQLLGVGHLRLGEAHQLRPGQPLGTKQRIDLLDALGLVKAPHKCPGHIAHKDRLEARLFKLRRQARNTLARRGEALDARKVRHHHEGHAPATHPASNHLHEFAVRPVDHPRPENRPLKPAVAHKLLGLGLGLPVLGRRIEVGALGRHLHVPLDARPLRST